MWTPLILGAVVGLGLCLFKKKGAPGNPLSGGGTY